MRDKECCDQSERVAVVEERMNTMKAELGGETNTMKADLSNTLNAFRADMAKRGTDFEKLRTDMAKRDRINILAMLGIVGLGIAILSFNSSAG